MIDEEKGELEEDEEEEEGYEDQEEQEEGQEEQDSDDEDLYRKLIEDENNQYLCCRFFKFLSVFLSQMY